MALLFVGPTGQYPTIAAAMANATSGDFIFLEGGYSNESATVTFNDITITGGASSLNIELTLAAGVSTVFLEGLAPINVLDSSDGNFIIGNNGDNVITVTAGADAVWGGGGIDRLIVDYSQATGAVTGDSTSNFTDAGGSGSVTINGGFEHFTILTGAFTDTITTGDGDDYINTGEGASTVTAGQGFNTIIGGSGADTVTALDGGNFIDVGDGANTVTTGAGADIILTGIDADTIVSGGGDDVVTLTGGADTVDTGAGFDRIVVDYSAMTTNVTGGITGGNLASGYTGSIADFADNTIEFTGVEQFFITTGSGNDFIVVGDADDVVIGGLGNDIVYRRHAPRAAR